MGRKYHKTLSKYKSPQLKPCLICGQEFWGWGNDKYCSVECADVAARKSQNDRTKNLRTEHPEYYRKGGKYFYPKIRKEKLENLINPKDL